jgi:hypothetical protein
MNISKTSLFFVAHIATAVPLFATHDLTKLDHITDPDTRIHIIQEFFADPETTTEMVNDNIIPAAATGSADIMPLFLQQERISAQSVNRALIWAVKENHLSVVQQLLDDARITQDTVQFTLVIAKDHKYQEIINELNQWIKHHSVKTCILL